MSSSSSLTRTNFKKKSNYVSDSERSKRLNANLIERRRMQNINSGFASLKKLLPPSDRKQTKAAILQQAAQYILRLQRAVIQFKTENDTLRSTLDSKNQSLACAKHSTHTSSHLHQLSKRHYESKPSQIMEHDSLLMAEPTTRPLGSANMDRHRNTSYKRTVQLKPTHNQTEMPSFDNNWRSFEHVKKYKPMISHNSGLLNRIELYPNAHAFESSPLTPPISPALNEKRVGSSSSAGKSRGTTIVSPVFKAPVMNNELMAQKSACALPQGPHPVKPPKRNIFNSSTQTIVQPAQQEKRARLMTEKENVEGKGRKQTKDPNHGDLQSILEAINIIENTKTRPRSSKVDSTEKPNSSNESVMSFGSVCETIDV